MLKKEFHYKTGIRDFFDLILTVFYIIILQKIVPGDTARLVLYIILGIAILRESVRIIFLKQRGKITVDEKAIRYSARFFTLLNWQMEWADIKDAWWRKSMLSTKVYLRDKQGTLKELDVRLWLEDSESSHVNVEDYRLFRELSARIKSLEKRESLLDKRSLEETGITIDQPWSNVEAPIMILVWITVVLVGIACVSVFLTYKWSFVGETISWWLIAIVTLFVIVPVYFLLKAKTKNSKHVYRTTVFHGLSMYLVIMLLSKNFGILCGSDVSVEYSLVKSTETERVWKSGSTEYDEISYNPKALNFGANVKAGRSATMIIREDCLGQKLIHADVITKIEAGT